MPSEKRDELEKKYAELAKKHGLPPLKEFEEEFGVKLKEPLIPNMLSTIYERLSHTARHFEVIITPQTLADWIESDFYDNKQREEIYALFKIFGLAVHEILLASFGSVQEQIAGLKKVLSTYEKELKPATVKFLQKQVDMWGKEQAKAGLPRHGPSYHG
jgi:hypothetical protein